MPPLCHGAYVDSALFTEQYGSVRDADAKQNSKCSFAAAQLRDAKVMGLILKKRPVHFLKSDWRGKQLIRKIPKKVGLVFSRPFSKGTHYGDKGL